MRPRLLPSRSCPHDWRRKRGPAVGQHPVPDLCDEELGAFHRMGGQAEGGQRGRLQHDPLHSVAGRAFEFDCS